MSTTQLFVELLVIGLGTVVALGFLLAAVFGLDLRSDLPRIDTAYAAVLAALAYVLGIIVDRLARAAFDKVEKRCRDQCLGTGLPSPEELQRTILVGHPALGAEIQYNRSRLRIARAWALNFLLTAIAFAIWNGKVQRFSPGECRLLFMAAVALAIISVWVAYRLCRDHYTNLAETHAFVERKGLTPVNDRRRAPDPPDPA